MMYDSMQKSRFKILRIIASRPRLFLCALAGLATDWVLPSSLAQSGATRLIISWNVGAILYLLLALRMMYCSSHEKLKARALQEDEGKIAILVLVVVAAVISLGAIVGELSVAKTMSGNLRLAHIGLGIVTILSSWAFTQVMFSLNYAHSFYMDRLNGNPGGLDFPGGKIPDYTDFLYFSCVIGTSSQTADVSFTNRPMRRIGLVHCVLAFFFNTTILALMVNIASGLF